MSIGTKKPEAPTADAKAVVPAPPPKAAELDEDDLDKVAGGRGGTSAG